MIPTDRPFTVASSASVAPSPEPGPGPGLATVAEGTTPREGRKASRTEAEPGAGGLAATAPGADAPSDAIAVAQSGSASHTLRRTGLSFSTLRSAGCHPGARARGDVPGRGARPPILGGGLRRQRGPLDVQARQHALEPSRQQPG